MERSDYRHTYLLFGLIGAGLVGAFALRAALVPESYGRTGHFRADATLDARAAAPRHLGEVACAECHEDEIALHAKDAHASVACETCHGPAWSHIGDPEAHALDRPKARARCLACHQLLAARPGWFPQIDPELHFRQVGVRDPETECIACHDPHEPLYMDRDLHKARLHPLIHRCRDCHIGRTDQNQPRPAAHPTIFECAYCHAGIVADHKGRQHSAVGCTTCHIFFVESESAGRILRDADPRFCLLCHREANFRAEGGPPTIRWPDHLEDVAQDEADRKKRCIDCHQDQIHLGPARGLSGRGAP